MKLDELTIRNIVREEILGKKSVILEDVQRPEDIEGDDGDWDDDDEDERPEDIEGDDGDWDDDDEDPAPAPARQGGGGGCRRPDVGRMQRIFMGEEGKKVEEITRPEVRLLVLVTMQTRLRGPLLFPEGSPGVLLYCTGPEVDTSEELRPPACR